MAWKVIFDKGVACFKNGDLEQALVHMNQAAELQSGAFIIYDSRAAVHERLGNLKAALRDSKLVIDLAPDRWQGYARSARLFDSLGKYASAIKMVDHALSRLREDDAQRRTPLVELREKAVVAHATTEKEHARTSYLLGKLPVESLIQIFTLLIDEDHTWSVELSHVCGHWRRILLDTPSAWQTLVLSRKRPMQKAKLWKQRAKNRIARIRIIDLSKLDRDSVFAELLALSWEYLRSLSISEEGFIQLHRMLCGVVMQHMLSRLEELVLFDAFAEDVPELSCCISGPDWKLANLHICGARNILDDCWPRIRQLKELRLSIGYLVISKEIFAANPLLEKLVLEESTRVTWPDPDDNNPVVMNHLKTIECRSMDRPLSVLGTIVAPSITHFYISSTPIEADEALFHMASRPSLVELRIVNCSLHASTLPTLLSSTTNLETLEVYKAHGVANDLFQFLTPKTVDPQHGLPCHALKHVDVSYCTDLTTSSVYAFVKARNHHASESVEPPEKCSAIASLTVDGCPNIEPEMLPWFRSKVARFSCLYATKKDLRKGRRRL